MRQSLYNNLENKIDRESESLPCKPQNKAQYRENSPKKEKKA